MKASIEYNGYVFTDTGRTQFGRKDTYVPEATGGVPQRRLITWTLAQVFKEPGFAENQSRYRALLAALQTPEGVLRITDENGTVIVDQRVRVEDTDLPEQWGEWMTDVKVTFTARENLTGMDPFSATYTPEGGAAIALPAVSGFKVSLKSERSSTAVPNRRETNCLVALSGKVRASEADTPAARRTFLLARQAALRSCDSRQGALVFGEFNETVRVDSVDADIRDGTDELDYSLALSFRRFPSGDYAEADYELSQADDLDRHERITSVRGRIRADDEAGARAKAEALRVSFATGRVLHKKDSAAQRLDGADGTAFTELSFAYEFREVLPGAGESWKLSIASKDDLKSGQIFTTYSGTVNAANSTLAIAKARALGDAKYPIRISSTETVSSTATDGSAEQFAEVAFSYEYLRKGAVSYAEVTSDVDRPTFGSSVLTVSGFAVADTQANAYTLARSFKPTGLLQRVDRESAQSVKATAETQFVKVDFTYTFHLAALSGSIQYGKKTAEDLDNREITTSFNGTAWAPTEGGAESLIEALLTGLTGRKGVDERTSNFDTRTTANFISRSFTLSMITPMAAGGNDILSAEYSIETTFSVNQAVITPIPFGSPHVQTNTGITPGLRVATGSITTLVAATGQSWARARIPSGGYEEPARERLQYNFVPFSGTTVKAYRFDFTYTKRYQSITF